MLIHFFIINNLLVKSVIPPFPVLETVQLLQNDAEKKVLLRLMCCPGTAKWRLGEGSVLGCGLLLRFIFLYIKKFLCFVVCCIFNGKRK